MTLFEDSPQSASTLNAPASQSTTTTPAVDAIGDIVFQGNIIPQTWYQHITFANGRPDLNGIIILAEICYWYRPVEVRDETTGELLGYRKKFKADMLQRSYQSFAEQFGISKRQAREALYRLRDRGLVRLELRNIKTDACVLTNVLFVEPVAENIRAITRQPREDAPASTEDPLHSNATPPTSKRKTSYIETEDLLHPNVTPPTSKRKTYTENTTENTTETTTIDQSVDPDSISSRAESGKMPDSDRLMEAEELPHENQGASTPEIRGEETTDAQRVFLHHRRLRQAVAKRLNVAATDRLLLSSAELAVLNKWLQEWEVDADAVMEAMSAVAEKLSEPPNRLQVYDQAIGKIHAEHQGKMKLPAASVSPDEEEEYVEIPTIDGPVKFRRSIVERVLEDRRKPREPNPVMDRIIDNLFRAQFETLY